MVENKRKKLNLGVMREFQQWLFLRIFAAIAFGALIGVLILYMYARYEVGALTGTVKIVRVSDLLVPVATAGGLVSIISGALLALFIPQKIAGPIYRLEKNLQALQAGDLTVTTTLRSGDILQDFASSMNHTVQSCRTKIVEIKELHGGLRELLSQNDLERLALQLDKEKEILDRFRT